MSKFSLNLIETDSEIRKKILEALSDEVNNMLNKVLPKITSQIKDLLASALRSQPEYSSLQNGELRYEFGIPNTSGVDTIVETIADNSKFIKKPIKITNLGLSGGFIYTILDDDTINGLIATDIASVITEDGTILPWLEWLLYSGVQPIVRNYNVKMGPNNRSRTGMAVMVQSRGSWGVPAQFAGTISNNWITRALDSIDDEINKAIETQIEVSV
jgi:hypothetical protein